MVGAGAEAGVFEAADWEVDGSCGCGCGCGDFSERDDTAWRVSTVPLGVLFTFVLSEGGFLGEVGLGVVVVGAEEAAFDEVDVDAGGEVAVGSISGVSPTMRIGTRRRFT